MCTAILRLYREVTCSRRQKIRYQMYLEFYRWVKRMYKKRNNCIVIWIISGVNRGFDGRQCSFAWRRVASDYCLYIYFTNFIIVIHCISYFIRILLMCTAILRLYREVTCSRRQKIRYQMHLEFYRWVIVFIIILCF
jgi:hypothetical protein